MNWQDVVSIKITEGLGLSIEVGWPFFLLIALGAVFWIVFAWRRARLFAHWAPVEAEVELGGIGKVTLRPGFEDIQIAHKAWVELVTRKAALPFDKEHDVVVEVYNSWYDLFQEIRSLTKSIPAERVRASEDTRKLVRLLVKALNSGLRPHLTKWQAKFRHWYDAAAKNRPDKSPQELQREYPLYSEMTDDLLKVNKQLVAYAKFIGNIAQGETDSGVEARRTNG